MHLGQALAAALLLLVPPSQATGTISGSVVDALGAPIPGVTITILTSDDAPKIVSGPDGRYSLDRVSAGRHALRASIAGFAWRQEEVDLIAGQTAKVDFVLCPLPVREISFIGPPSLAELFAQSSVVAHVRVTSSQPTEGDCRGEARVRTAVIEALKPSDPNLTTLAFIQEQWVEEPAPYPVGTELVVFLRGDDRLTLLHGPFSAFMVEDAEIRPSKFLARDYRRYVGTKVEDLLRELRWGARARQ